MIIYLMLYLPFPIFCKIGFAQHDVFARANAIDKAVWGRFQPVCWIYVPFAYALEQKFHKAFKFLAYKFYKGSGCTETYLLPAAIPALGFMLLYWGVCFWVLGIIFNFDGLEWYACFLQVLYGWGKEVWNYFFLK